MLRFISEDILAFEKEHGKLADIVPDRFAKYQVGRLYDMVLGPGTSRSTSFTDPPPKLVVIGPYEHLPATCNDHDPRPFRSPEQVVI